MTDWHVFEIIVALIAFVATVVAPIIRLNTSIVKLTSIVDKMATELDSLTNKNETSHDKIFTTLGDHETRITVLEKEKQI